MKRPLACTLLLLGLASAPAHAQSPLTPPDLARYLRWGPVRVRPGLVVSNLGYDDNIYYRTGQDAKREGDYVVTLSPRAEGVVLLGKRAFLTFTEQIDYTRYKSHGDLSYFNHNGKARLTVPFRRLGVFLDGGLADTKDRPLDQLDARLTRREQRLGAGLIFKTGWRTDLEVGISRSDWSNEDPDNVVRAQDLDRTEESVSLRARYLLLGRTRLLLEALDRSYDFDDPASVRDTDERRLVPGVEFGAGGRLTGSLRLGRSRLDARDPRRSDFSETVGEAKLAYRVGSGTTLQVNGRRDLSFSIWQEESFLLNTSVEARVIHYLNRVVGLEAGASRGRVVFTGSDRRDASRQYDVGVRLRLMQNDLGRRIEYALRLTNWSVDSTPNELYNRYDQSRTTFGISMVLGY